MHFPAGRHASMGKRNAWAKYFLLIVRPDIISFFFRLSVPLFHLNRARKVVWRIDHFGSHVPVCMCLRPLRQGLVDF